MACVNNVDQQVAYPHDDRGHERRLWSLPSGERGQGLSQSASDVALQRRQDEGWLNPLMSISMM